MGNLSGWVYVQGCMSGDVDVLHSFHLAFHRCKQMILKLLGSDSLVFCTNAQKVGTDATSDEIFNV